MNSLFQKHKWMQVMWGILLFVAGAVSIVFTATQKDAAVSISLRVAIAVILFAYGLTILFTSFLELKTKFFKSEMIVGGLVIAVGIVFCIKDGLIEEILVWLASSILLVFGALFLVRGALYVAGKDKRNGLKVLCFIIAALFVAAGVLAIIFDEFSLEICYYVIAAIMMILGVLQIVLTIKRAIGEKQKAVAPTTPVVKDEPKPEDNEVVVVDNQ